MRPHDRRLRIDFTPPGFMRSVHRAGPGTWLLVAAALVLCAGAAWLGSELAEQRERYDAEIAAVLAAHKAPPPPPAAELPRIAEAQAASVNAAIAQLNLPWRALQDAVAGATPASIALLALEPDARKHALKITAEARNADDMVGYVEQLGRQELFNGVVLTRHEINEQDPLRPIRFQIEAAWSQP
jgi:hypothetical protein